jgi:regulator of replication initiation timing
VIETAKRERVTAIKFTKTKAPSDTKKHVRLKAKIREFQEENRRLRHENEYIRKQIATEERRTMDPKEVKFYSELSNVSAEAILEKIKNK